MDVTPPKRSRDGQDPPGPLRNINQNDLRGAGAGAGAAIQPLMAAGRSSGRLAHVSNASRPNQEASRHRYQLQRTWSIGPGHGSAWFGGRSVAPDVQFYSQFVEPKFALVTCSSFFVQERYDLNSCDYWYKHTILGLMYGYSSTWEMTSWL